VDLYAAPEFDGSLSLVCRDEHITKIFEITGPDRLFPALVTFPWVG